MSNVKLDITIDEANLILEALGEMPFKRVFGLVSKVQQQASEQLGVEGSAPQSLSAVPDSDIAEAS